MSSKKQKLQPVQVATTAADYASCIVSSGRGAMKGLTPSIDWVSIGESTLDAPAELTRTLVFVSWDGLMGSGVSSMEEVSDSWPKGTCSGWDDVEETLALELKKLPSDRFGTVGDCSHDDKLERGAVEATVGSLLGSADPPAVLLNRLPKPQPLAFLMGSGRAIVGVDMTGDWSAPVLFWAMYSRRANAHDSEASRISLASSRSVRVASNSSFIVSISLRSPSSSWATGS